ncbi:MAG TPA: RHS repeat-associated core domain-containing protein [Pseudonocardiaceae bacterium]
MVSGFTIRPNDLRNSAGTLENLAGQIGTGGQRMKTAGESLVAHASGDKSGVGSVIAKAFGKALTTTGDVFSQASRISKGSSDRLHGNANAHESNEHNTEKSFRDLHPNSNGGSGTHPKDTSPGNTRPSSSGTSGSGGSSVRNDGTGNIRPNNNQPAHNSTPTEGLPGCGDPVDVATGRMFLTQLDVELRAVLPLVVSRTHLSTFVSGRWFGPTWASTVDQRVEVDAAGVSFAAEDGSLLSYPLPGDAGTVLPEFGPRWPLGRTGDGGFTIAVPDRAQTLVFSSAGLITAIVHNVGGRIDIERNADGTPTAITHSSGYRIVVRTDDGLITELRLPRPAVNGDMPADLVLVRYRYDDARRLVEVTNSSGLPLRYDYDPSGRIVAWRDRNGFGYRYVFDGDDRCVRTEGDGGYLTYTYAYDHRVTLATNSLGNTTAFHFNDALQLVREVDPLGNETSFEWDRHHKPLRETDALGNTTSYRYDDVGNLRELIRPDGTKQVTEYDDRHRPVIIVDPDGAVWRREYGPIGELLATVDPAGARTAYRYDQAGHLAATIDALGNTTTMTRDRRGLIAAVTDPNGATTEYGYDEMGRVASITDPTGRTTRYGWTVEGLPATATQPDGATEHWTHDGEGNLREQRDAIGNTTVLRVGGFDLPTARIAADGSRQEFGYDTELRLTWVRNERGDHWRYEYDAAGNLVRETDFDGRVLRYGYDAAHRMVRRTNGAGQTVEFTLDPVGRMVERRAGNDVTRLTYDPADRVLSAVNADADLRFGYDPRGLVVAETCNGRTVRSEYDAMGRRITRTLPSGARSDWTYDAAGAPTQLRVGGHALAMRRDAAGRDIGRTWGSTTISQDWDPVGRLAAQTVTAASGVVQQREYSYRADGLPTGVRDTLAGSRAFELDRMGRVTTVTGNAGGQSWTEHYGYDATGNITDARWPGGDPLTGRRQYAGTKLTTAGTTSYAHDAQGRVVRRTGPGPDGRPRNWEFGWTAEDRMVSVTTPDGQRWRYRYDALGRRIAKQRLGPGDAVAEQVDFTWDGQHLAEEHHRAPTGQRRLTSWELEPGTDLPLTQSERFLGDGPQSVVDQRFYAIVTDLVGSPAELVGPDGAVSQQPWHTLWGRTATPAAPTPLRFPGQYYDTETGLHYNVHRYFDPAAGRFTSPDPLGLLGGPNPQSYVPNPTAWIDPLGLTPCKTSPSGSGGGQGGANQPPAGGNNRRGGGRQRKPPKFLQQPNPTNVVDPQVPLYHYTEAAGHQGITTSGEIWPSQWEQGNPNNAHARFGSGVYLTQIKPGSVSQEELSQQLVLNPNTGHRFTHYIELDPQKLQQQGYTISQSPDRPDVWVAHHGPLDQPGEPNMPVGKPGEPGTAITDHGPNPPYNPPPPPPPPPPVPASPAPAPAPAVGSP